MTKLLVVTRCSACPFFEDGPLGKIGGLLVKALMAESQTGVCNLLPSGDFVPTNDLKMGLPPGPERDAEEPRFVQARARRAIYDKRSVPDDCPLRHDDVSITIAGGN